MNKKKFLFSFLILATVILLSGCSLAKMPDPQSTQSSARLMGIYLVIHDENEEPGADANWVEYGSSSVKTEFGNINLPDRILPSVYDSETKHHSFPDLKGYALFCANVSQDEEEYNVGNSDFSDSHYGVIITDGGDSYELSGTLYIDEKALEDKVFTAYRVMEDENNLVFIDEITSSYQGGEGGFSASMDEKIDVTVNGKKETVYTEVSFEVEGIQRLKKLKIYQYNRENQLIGSMEITPSMDIPPVSWREDAAWCMIEETYENESVKRTAYDRPSPSEEEAVTHTVYIMDDNYVGHGSLVTIR